MMRKTSSKVERDKSTLSRGINLDICNAKGLEKVRGINGNVVH